MHERYYAAFGSNLNQEQMKERCPNSVPYKSAMLNNFRLSFRSVADIIPNKGTNVPIGIYTITKACEISLDNYESFPTLYTKKNLIISIDNKPLKIMLYMMNKNYGFGEPSQAYYETIKKGYQDWGLNTWPLRDAFSFSKENDSGTSYRSIVWDNKK